MVDRDDRRQNAQQVLTSLLGGHYKEFGYYPESFEKANQNFSAKGSFFPMLKDPKTDNVYEYKSLNNGANYKLCINFETFETKCASPIK
jgi:hypothetical protein